MGVLGWFWFSVALFGRGGPGLGGRRSDGSPAPLSSFGYLGMAKSCRPQLDRLIACVASCPCVAQEGRGIKECLAEMGKAEERGQFEKCDGLRRTYFNCKRGQIDMRSRIRGNRQSGGEEG